MIHVKFASVRVICISCSCRAGQLRKTMGESLRRWFDLTGIEFSLRLQIIANPSTDHRCKKGQRKNLRWERETKRYCRRTVLRSIIDDPTCICGARHVLKPVSRSIPRIICARIGSGYPHDSILISFSSSLTSSLFHAAICDWKQRLPQARMWAGPDSRLPTPYFRR